MSKKVLLSILIEIEEKFPEFRAFSSVARAQICNLGDEYESVETLSHLHSICRVALTAVQEEINDRRMNGGG